MRVRVRPHVLNVVSEDSPRHCLTADREYFVLGVDEEDLRVVSDDGEPILYPKYLFEILDNSLPPDWHFKEGDDGDYYLNPRKTAAPGFYEQYFCSNGDTQAQLSAHRALRAALEDAVAWGQEADRQVLTRDMSRLAEREKQALARPGYR